MRLNQILEPIVERFLGYLASVQLSFIVFKNNCLRTKKYQNQFYRSLLKRLYKNQVFRGSENHFFYAMELIDTKFYFVARPDD